MKKLFTIFMLIAFSGVVLSGCGQDETGSDDIPVLDVGWAFDLHTGAFLAAMEMEEDFKGSGYYLKSIYEEEQYELYSEQDELIAMLNTVVIKGGSEAVNMMGQDQLDASFNSITAVMSGRDQDIDIQGLCPVHVDGMGLVFPPDTDFYGWKDVKDHIKEYDDPFKIGYHSPVSGPRVAIEAALNESELTVSEDPYDTDADVILINLNGIQNLQPSLRNEEVNAWVGPSHFPEQAEDEGSGKIVLELEDFPPAGEWVDFPCCVFSARAETIEKHPEAMNALVDILTYSAEWIEENNQESSELLADMIGISKEAVKSSSIVFTTEVTDNWIEGNNQYMDVHNHLDKFEGNLQDKTFDDIKDDLMYLDFIY